MKPQSLPRGRGKPYDAPRENKVANGPLPKSVTFGSSGLRQMAAGLELLVRVLRATYGPSGGHVAMPRKLDSPILVRDAALICKDFALHDRLRNCGAQLLREALSKIDRIAGDGGTTTAILLDGMISRGLTQIAGGADPTRLCQGMQQASEAVVDHLARQVVDVDADRAVRTLLRTGSFDPEMSRLIGEALQAVGKEGVVRVRESKRINSTLVVHDGVHVDQGSVSALLAQDTSRLETRLRNPYILLVDGPLASHKDVVGILGQVHAIGGSLLVVARSIEGDALSTLIRNGLAGTMPLAAIRSEEYGDQRDAALQDLAALTGGIVCGQSLGGSIPLEYFGRADEVVVSKSSTLILGARRNSSQVRLRIEEARDEMDDDRLSQHDKERRCRRLGNLLGKTAVLNVGGTTDVEVGELLEKTERVMRAVRLGLRSGVVPGAGSALIAAASQASRQLDGLGADERAGVEIVLEALAEPARQLLRNAEIDEALAEDILLRYANPCLPAIYDLVDLEWLDPSCRGAVDSLEAAKGAVQVASSMASVLLRSSIVITEDVH
jgi:chaperonin GroEL